MIYPMHTVDSTAHEYISGGVHTTHANRQHVVGVSYHATSIAEVIRQAYLNALVKRMRLGLAEKLTVACECEPSIVSVRVSE
jgi:hypothetical protein